jgi:hypothetical protein
MMMMSFFYRGLHTRLAFLLVKHKRVREAPKVGKANSGPEFKRFIFFFRSLSKSSVHIINFQSPPHTHSIGEDGERGGRKKRERDQFAEKVNKIHCEGRARAVESEE